MRKNDYRNLLVIVPIFQEMKFKNSVNNLTALNIIKKT